MTEQEALDAQTLTTAGLMSLPPTISVELAGRAFGVGRDTAYKLVRAGEFPCQVVRAGRRYRVVTADLRRVLGIQESTEDANVA
ncbi:helix-turn-helix transcriptional regulator [Streptomyces shenzhenensis]